MFTIDCCRFPNICMNSICFNISTQWNITFLLTVFHCWFCYILMSFDGIILNSELDLAIVIPCVCWKVRLYLLNLPRKNVKFKLFDVSLSFVCTFFRLFHLCLLVNTYVFRSMTAQLKFMKMCWCQWYKMIFSTEYKIINTFQTNIYYFVFLLYDLDLDLEPLRTIRTNAYPSTLLLFRDES